MFKKLKGLFIIEDDSNKAEASGNATSNLAGSGSTKANSTHKKGSGEPGKVSDKFLKVLLGALEANNLDGFDYLEFKDFLRSLEHVKMEESTRFRSAFATAQTMGATLEKLKDSAQHYIEVLSGERKKFDQAVTNRRTQVLDLQKAKIKELEQSVKDKMARIKSLKQEIETTDKNISQKKDEFASSEARVERANTDFIHTYQVLVEQIQNDVIKIDTFLS